MQMINEILFNFMNREKGKNTIAGICKYWPLSSQKLQSSFLFDKLGRRKIV